MGRFFLNADQEMARKGARARPQAELGAALAREARRGFSSFLNRLLK